MVWMGQKGFNPTKKEDSWHSNINQVFDSLPCESHVSITVCNNIRGLTQLILLKPGIEEVSTNPLTYPHSLGRAISLHLIMLLMVMSLFKRTAKFSVKFSGQYGLSAWQFSCLGQNNIFTSWLVLTQSNHWVTTHRFYIYDRLGHVFPLSWTNLSVMIFALWLFELSLWPVLFQGTLLYLTASANGAMIHTQCLCNLTMSWASWETSTFFYLHPGHMA